MSVNLQIAEAVQSGMSRAISSVESEMKNLSYNFQSASGTRFSSQNSGTPFFLTINPAIGGNGGGGYNSVPIYNSSSILKSFFIFPALLWYNPYAAKEMEEIEEARLKTDELPRGGCPTMRLQDEEQKRRGLSSIQRPAFSFPEKSQQPSKRERQERVNKRG